MEVQQDTPVPTCHGGLADLEDEFDYWIDEVAGEVPADLHGTFVRNGPGRLSVGGQRYGHWFDGDGMLSRFTFVNGRAHFRNGFVRTRKYVEETRHQGVRFRGLGTQIPGGWLKNAFRKPVTPANTNTIYHGKRLLALNESGLPWEVDPRNLETLGEYDYERVLKNRTFSAHGKVHALSGDLINFGTGMDWRSPRPCIHIYRIDSLGKVRSEGRIQLGYFPFLHDFALGSAHAAFFLSSISFTDIAGAFFGKRSIADCMKFDESRPMKVIVVSLNDFSVVREFELDAGSVVHFGNAFEREDTLVVDALHSDSFDGSVLRDVFEPGFRISGGELRRYGLNLNSGSVSVTSLSDLESEFPSFNRNLLGLETKACYTACAVANGATSCFNAIQRVSDDNLSGVVTLPQGFYASEPLFAPALGADREDDGYVLVVVYNAHEHRSELRIYRASRVEDEVARLGLKHHLPHQFHGYFTSEVFVDPSAAELCA